MFRLSSLGSLVVEVMEEGPERESDAVAGGEGLGGARLMVEEIGAVPVPPWFPTGIILLASGRDERTRPYKCMVLVSIK